MKVKMTSNVFATDGRVIRMGEEVQTTKQKKGAISSWPVTGVQPRMLVVSSLRLHSYNQTTTIYGAA